jgi:hypothetical protein
MIERGKMEWKTKVAGIASYLAGVALLGWLAESATDFVEAWPDWLESAGYAAIPAVTALVAGYVARHKPDALSGSAVLALRQRVRGREDWHPAEHNVKG